MSKILFERKQDKIIIINRLSYPETVNERVYNAILSGMYEGFLPVCIKQKGKEIRVECTVQDMLPLTQYFKGIITKKMFLDFAFGIASEIKECEKNMINANNLDLQRETIFLDLRTKKVKCIFWPIVNNQRDNPPHLFLKQLPFELHFNPHENNEYLETYKAFFNSLTPFSVNGFERMLFKLSGKNDTDSRAAPSEALLGGSSRESSSGMRHHEIKGSNIEYDPFSVDDDNVGDMGAREVSVSSAPIAVYCPYCGNKNQIGSNFCVYCGTRLCAVSQGETNESMQTEKGNAGSAAYVCDKSAEPTHPVLIRAQTGHVVVIDKPVFRIGTGQSYCDLYISDNTYISRNHADILTRGGRYYIVDRHSTNGTFVNGVTVPAEMEYELLPGAKIQLANELFTFLIQPRM